jgi:hypothetical protein
MLSALMLLKKLALFRAKALEVAVKASLPLRHRRRMDDIGATDL